MGEKRTTNRALLGKEAGDPVTKFQGPHFTDLYQNEESLPWRSGSVRNLAFVEDYARRLLAAECPVGVDCLAAKGGTLDHNVDDTQ